MDDAVNGAHDPGQGAKNVQQFVADSAVLGMVGPFNSSVARAEMPIANTAGLAMISPANTNECLTQEPPDGHCAGQAAKLRPKGGNNYFRVCTTDLIQGPAAADYAYNKLGKKKVYVLTDKTTYGQGIATLFKTDAPKVGLKIAGAREVPSICPYCAVGCGQLISVRDGNIINIEGNPESPISRGTLCPKGAATYQLAVNPLRIKKVWYRAPGATEWDNTGVRPHLGGPPPTKGNCLRGMLFSAFCRPKTLMPCFCTPVSNITQPAI